MLRLTRLALLAAGLLSLGADCGPGGPLWQPQPARVEIDPFAHLGSERVWAALAVGSEQSCGLSVQGEVFCRGFEGEEAPIGPRGPYTELAVGTEVCALNAEQLPSCWPDWVGAAAPVPPQNSPLQGLSSAWGLWCGIDDDDAIVCWGEEETARIPPADGSSYSQVAVGDMQTCALGPQGELSCWGLAGAIEGMPAGEFQAVTAGAGASCAVTVAGSVSCWGDPGTLPPPPSDTARAVELHGRLGCLLTLDDEVLCWGAELPPARYSDGPFVDISVGRAAGCGLTEEGRAECWLL